MAGTDFSTQTTFWCSRGLACHKSPEGIWDLVDVAGQRTAIGQVASAGELNRATLALAKVAVISPLAGTGVVTGNEVLRLDDMFFRIEELYVARIPDYYRILLCGKGDRNLFDAKKLMLPIAYQEVGFGGSGGKEILEFSHQFALELAKDRGFITRQIIAAFLTHIELKRLCDAVYAHFRRACFEFRRLVTGMRSVVQAESALLNRMEWNELTHKSEATFQLATCVTNGVISLATTLEVLAKLVQFVNATEFNVPKYQIPHFNGGMDLTGIRPALMSECDLSLFRSLWIAEHVMNEIALFRHDVVHNTFPMELERNFYIGKGTPFVNELPLLYCYMPWRDSMADGKPVRCMGRSFFTGSERDMDATFGEWIAAVYSTVDKVGQAILDKVIATTSSAAHVLTGTELLIGERSKEEGNSA
jgi:hypothetical protein